MTIWNHKATLSDESGLDTITVFTSDQMIRLEVDIENDNGIINFTLHKKDLLKMLEL